MRTTLAGHGYTVAEAGSLAEAISAIDRNHPHVVLLDLGLPDQPRHTVTVHGQEVHLTPIEFRLLLELARQPGRVLTHHQLLREIWGPKPMDEVHNLRVHMATLRRKIEADPARPQWLLTEAGVGYRMREPAPGLPRR